MDEKMLSRFRAAGIIPVIALEDADDSEDLASALCRGGLPAAEVTFRTAAAAETLRRMREAQPEMLVGAGTVLTVQQARDAMEAGAEFVVSPGLNPAVVTYCLDRDLPVCPGVATATEIEQALALGLHAVKFFPAEPMGGLKTIRALAAPYGMMHFMPTGGISPENIADYLAFDRIFAAGGSWMVTQPLLVSRDFSRIEALAREAAEIVRRVRSDRAAAETQ